MTDLTYFTVEADFRSVLADAADINTDPDIGTVTATVTFKPMINDGDVILAPDADPRPTGFVATPIVGIVDSADGRLKLRNVPDGTRGNYSNLASFPAQGDSTSYYVAADTGLRYRWVNGAYTEIPAYVPVRLLADTPVLNLASPLFYTVSFSGVQVGDRAGNIKAITFQAPNADVTVNLIDVIRAPGQPAVGITRIGPGGVRLEDDNVIFTFDDIDINGSIPASAFVGVNDVTTSNDAIQFLWNNTPVGNPISLLVSALDGGTPSSTSDGFIDGGTL